jgi:hypothetical protein
MTIRKLDVIKDSIMKNATNETTEQMAAQELTESNRHQLLSIDRRRVLLEVLGERSKPVGIDELAEAIANRESDTGTASDKEIQNVHLSLYHKHLPKMAEMDLINYDRSTDQVV